MDNDYLYETLKTEPKTQKEIFLEMLEKLESNGDCRGVYHRLYMVIFNEDCPMDA